MEQKLVECWAIAHSIYITTHTHVSTTGSRTGFVEEAEETKGVAPGEI